MKHLKYQSIMGYLLVFFGSLDATESLAEHERLRSVEHVEHRADGQAKRFHTKKEFLEYFSRKVDKDNRFDMLLISSSLIGKEKVNFDALVSLAEYLAKFLGNDIIKALSLAVDVDEKDYHILEVFMGLHDSFRTIRRDSHPPQICEYIVKMFQYTLQQEKVIASTLNPNPLSRALLNGLNNNHDFFDRVDFTHNHKKSVEFFTLKTPEEITAYFEKDISRQSKSAESDSPDDANSFLGLKVKDISKGENNWQYHSDDDNNLMYRVRFTNGTEGVYSGLQMKAHTYLRSELEQFKESEVRRRELQERLRESSRVQYRYMYR